MQKSINVRKNYVLMSSDYSQSQQEPKCLAALCRQDGDPQMYETFMQGKDLYAEIASKAFNYPYEDCLEFYLDENGNKTDRTNKEGKGRRTQAKSILLGYRLAPIQSDLYSKQSERIQSGVTLMGC